MSWTDDRVDILRKLWTDGLSASQIAAELGGVTRNAVIGKVHRLGLSGRVKGANQSGGGRRKNPTKTTGAKTTKSGSTGGRTTNPTPPAPRPAPVVDVPEPVPMMLDLLQLTDVTCKFPIGDPQESSFGFCGSKSRDGDPYCEYHCRVAYQPAADRRRDRSGRTAAQIAAKPGPGQAASA